MWLLDFPSLVLIIAVGIQLGLKAAFGWDAAHQIFGEFDKIIFEAMGISAVWQLFRQRFH